MRSLRRYATSLSLLVILSGCNLTDSPEETTLDMACNADKEFCEKIQADSRCRNERKAMILTRHDFQTTQDKEFAFDALVSTEKFVKCAELALNIQYASVLEKYADVDATRTRELTEKEVQERYEYGESTIKRKNQKINNFRYAEKELRRLEGLTVTSKIPELSYYHWTRKGNNEASKNLVKLDKEGKIKTSWLQYQMAQHYASYDEELTLRALHNSLTLYPKENYTDKKGDPSQDKYNKFDDEGNMHFNIFRSLASLHYQKGNYGASYVYAKLLELNNDVTADLGVILQRIEGNSKQATLDKMADNIDELLDDGKLTLKHLVKLERYRV